MIGNQSRSFVKPEIRNLRQHLAFSWNAVGHNTVKCRDAVGGDKEQLPAQIENLADLAALDFLDSRQFEL